MGRPNILIIMSDQHNPHVAGYAGEDRVRTPNLDRLASRGVSLDACYCAGPLCVPSRMSFLAGQFPSDIQTWTNGEVLSSDVPTFAHQLSLAGYETVLCGRMHFVGPDQHHGFDRRLVGDVSGAMAAGSSGLFEEVWSRAGCGQSYGSHLDDAVGPGQAIYAVFDDFVTVRAGAFLADRRTLEAPKPFAMVVGYLLPHNPYVCPPDLFAEYLERLKDDASPVEVPEDEHPAVGHLRETRGAAKITPEQALRARAAYFGLVTCLDRNIGSVLDALDASGEADNTVVVYTSDHGELGGEHGLWWKDSFYEGSVRVPAIWSWPGRFEGGRRVAAVTSLLDVAPTVLSLAGAEDLPGARGHDLTPILSGTAPVEPWPDVAFAETFANGQRPARMMRKGRWKLNLYHGYDGVQLFDLESDPDELRDLGQDPAHAEVRERLRAEAAAGWDGDWIERRSPLRVKESRIGMRWIASDCIRESERWTMPDGCNVREEG